MAARLDDRAAGAIERAAVAEKSADLLALSRDYRAGKISAMDTQASARAFRAKRRIAAELLEKAILLLDDLSLRAITNTTPRGANRDKKEKP